MFLLNRFFIRQKIEIGISTYVNYCVNNRVTSGVYARFRLGGANPHRERGTTIFFAKTSTKTMKLNTFWFMEAPEIFPCRSAIVSRNGVQWLKIDIYSFYIPFCHVLQEFYWLPSFT